MNDAILLARLLQDDRLLPFERRAFGDMQTSGLQKYGSLTHAQRAWAQRVGARLGLPVEAVASDVPQRSAWDPETKAPERATARRHPRCPLCKHRAALHHVDGIRVPCRWQDGRARCGCRGRYQGGKKRR